MSSIKSAFAFVTVAALTLTGCAEPMEGEWEYEKNDASYDESWTLEPDGAGDFRIKLTATDGSFTINGDVGWEEGGRDQEYAVDFECTSLSIGSCTLLEDAGYASRWSFECIINDDGNELDCEPEGGGDKFTMEKVDG